MTPMISSSSKPPEGGAFVVDEPLDDVLLFDPIFGRFG
jgi:hypothetical protein